MFNLSKLFGFNSEWENEKHCLDAFASDLRELGDPTSVTDLYQYLVDFFNICSDFQDKFRRVRHCPNQDLMVAFNRTLENSGRCRYGMNRTREGEKVTLDNVYLGDVFGLFTHTARTWRSSDDTVYDGFNQRWLHKDGKDPIMSEVIARHQVFPFVEKNRKALLDGIAKMKEA